MATAVPQEKVNGLSTYLSIIFAPREAFAQLARTPMWGWAALIGMILAVAAPIISLPEIQKIGDVARQQALSQMSADQQAQAQSAMAMSAHLTPIFATAGAAVFIWLFWLVTALIYLGAAALTGGTATFGRAWVAVLNASIAYFVASLINAIILALRGPDAIGSAVDAYALPSLAMIVHGGVKLVTFLYYTTNLGAIWGYIVSVIALEQMLKMGRGASIATVVVITLIATGLAVWGAR